MELGPTQEYEDHSITTALQKLIADKFKEQVEKALVALLELLANVEQVFRSATLSAKGWHTYCGVQCRGITHSRSYPDSLFGETINKQVDKLFKADRASKGLRKMMLHNDEILNQIASFIEMQTKDTIISQSRFDVLKTVSIASCSTKNAAVVEEASFAQEALARVRSESSNKERFWSFQTSLASHVEPATVPAASIIETEIICRATRTQKCQQVTWILEGRINATVGHRT